jgi:ribonucleoside-diphosphate reductase beta chain
MLARRSFWPSFFSAIVARLQWNAAAIDLAPDAGAWPGLPAERRRRLTTLLAGFCVAEAAVSEHLEPFAEVAREASMVSQESLVAWVFYLQRRDEQRHALLFDRIAAEVLGLPGATPAERRAAAPAHVPAELLELFEERLPPRPPSSPRAAPGWARGSASTTCCSRGSSSTPGSMRCSTTWTTAPCPGVREGVERVERDERWHIGFGLRCLIEAQPSRDLLDDLLERAEEAAEAWGDAVPLTTRESSARKCAHRLHVAGLVEAHAA